MHASRVLVVDDEPLIQEMLRECFLSQGWAAVCAGDADEALRLVRPGDVALVDAVLPGAMTGLALAARLEAAGVPVLMMSGQPEALEEITATHRRVILAKPFRVNEVVAALESLRRKLRPAGVRRLFVDA